MDANDGNINAKFLQGRLEASSDDGQIPLEGHFELLDLRTGDGSIHLARLEEALGTSAFVL